jgi:acyl-coenzyme A thioesterase PaaI-like protein
MSEARAAMDRVFEERSWDSLPDDQLAALTELTAQTRELIAAVLLSDLEADELCAVADQVKALHQRLSTRLRPDPPIGAIGEDRVVHQLGSPVTGAVNPIAPPLVMEVLPDGTARAEFTLGPVYEGPPGCVHGGVSAMILDHLCGCAAAANGTPGMTAGLDLRYRRPTPHSVPLVAQAKTVRVDGRKTFVEGYIAGPDGLHTAEATGVFVMPMR